MTSALSPARRARPVTPAGIVAERLRRLEASASATNELAPDLLQELQEITTLAAGLERYTEASTTPESAALAELAARTRARDWDAREHATVAVEQEMLTGHVEGTVLRFLVAMSAARTVLEIGMFTGYSALAMAEALPEDGRVIACELDPEVAAYGRSELERSAAGRKVEVCVGPALTTLARLSAAREQFDFVFIDADKAGYVDYVQAILDGDLLADGGTICVDNTLLQGEPWTAGPRSANGAAITRFNEAIAADRRIEQVLLPVRDGMTLIRRRM